MPTPIDRPTRLESKPGRWAIPVIVLIFGLHTYQAIRLFPSVDSIINPSSPVVMVDHAIHEYHGRLGAQFFHEAGTTWGFDPFFMAGYPETPVWDSSSNPSILFHLLGGGTTYRAYKIGLLVASILLLAAITGGTWAIGLGWAEAAVASILGWFVFWTGFPATLWRSGLFAFVSASAGIGLLLGLCVRFGNRPRRINWLALSVTGAGLFFLHITSPIMAAGGALAFYVSVAWRQSRRWHMAVFGALAVTLLANLVWLVPLLKFREIRTGSGFFMTSNSAWFLIDYVLGATIEGRCTLILLLAGLAGLVAWWFRGRRSSAAAFGGSILALLILTGLGSLWEPTKTLEPLRFRVPLQFLLIVPAASALVTLSGAMARRLGGGRRGSIAVGLFWIVTLGGWGAIDRGFFLASALTLSKERPLAVGLTPEMQRMVDWIKVNTDGSARILFEDQLRLLETTDPESVHWTPLLPFLLQPETRLFIGGLYQTAFIRHHLMSAFGDFQLGNRTIDAWSHDNFRRYCDRYNVGWVICWSPLSRYWFDRFEPAIRMATLARYASVNWPPSSNEHEWKAMIQGAGLDVARRYMFEGERTYAIYRLDRPRTYFLRGKGRIISVRPNRIELADVEPEAGAVVLSLHWLDTWKTDPPLVLSPEPVPPDPVDFVRIEVAAPTRSIVLFNSYGHR